MPLNIISLGQKAPQWCDLAFSEYHKRLQRFCKLKVTDLPISAWHKKNNIQRAMQEESDNVLSHIQPTDFVITLDERGKSFSSTALAQKISDWQQNYKNLIFVIGGPTGHAPSLKEKSNQLWSLSELTFPHRLIKVMLIEQIYRAFCIQSNHPYHKE
jgi:23S rRNA (pseudouridine1915-N3)-methyltransferase